MKISVQELSSTGPSIHSAFQDLPFIRALNSDERIPKPLLAYQSSSCIKIIGDIYRFEAARERGVAVIPVYLIQESESTMELLQILIDYLSPMNLMDKALLTRAALELGMSPKLIADNLFKHLEIPPRGKSVDQLLFLLSLPKSLQHFIVDKDLSLKRALIFQRAEGHLDWVEQFISNLRIGINMSAEIIQNIWELAQLEDKDFESKAREMGLWEMAETDYADTRLAVMEIREKINAARYPKLSQAGRDLSRTIQALDLPATLKLTWDHTFEKQGVDISFHAKDEHELDDVLEKLAAPAFKNIFKQI